MSNSIPTFSSPSINISENLKNANENEIDNQNKQQIKEKKKNESFDKNEDNNSIININNNVNNNNNNVKSRSLSASFDLKKNNAQNTTLKNDDVTALRKYSGHTYVRTSFDTSGIGEAPYSSSTYTASASPVQSVGRYSIENLDTQGPSFLFYFLFLNTFFILFS